MSQRRAALAAACLAALVSAPGRAHGAPGGWSYQVHATYRIAGDPAFGGIALDAAARRIYVAHGRVVSVLDADTGAPDGTLSLGFPAGSVAVLRGAGVGVVAARAGDELAIFGLADLRLRHSLRLRGAGPYLLAYAAGARRLFAASTRAGVVQALDPRTGRIGASLKLPAPLEAMAANGYGELFVAAEPRGDSVVHVVATRRPKFLGDFPVGDCEGAMALAIDPVGRRLFVPCANGNLAVIDADVGMTFARLAVGKGVPAAVFTFDPQGRGGWRGAAFVASAGGRLTAVRMNSFVHYSQGLGVPTVPGVRAIAFDAQTHTLLLAVRERAGTPAQSGAGGASASGGRLVLLVLAAER